MMGGYGAVFVVLFFRHLHPVCLPMYPHGSCVCGSCVCGSYVWFYVFGLCLRFRSHRHASSHNVDHDEPWSKKTPRTHQSMQKQNRYVGM